MFTPEDKELQMTLLLKKMLFWIRESLEMIHGAFCMTRSLTARHKNGHPNRFRRK
jgi:hypothetical protein